MASRGLNCHSTGVMSRRDRYNYRHSLQPCRVLSDSDSDVVMRDGDAVPDIFIDDAAAAGSESDCRSHVFQDFERESLSLRGFQSLRESQQLIDVTLSVDGQQFSCHRALLASASEYFCCLFTTSLAEQNQAVITISGVDANSMRLVLDYVYTGRVELNSDTVQNLLSSANLFQLRGLRDGCADYMERKIEIDNCIGVHFFAQAHECRELELQAWNVIIENFDAVTDNPEFLDMSAENLLEIIKYDDIQAVEEEVFDAVMRWFLHCADERSVYIHEVMRFIRFWLIEEHYLYDRVLTNALLRANEQVLAMLNEVVHYKLLKDRWMEADLYMEPRYGSDFCRVIVYTAYMDDEKKQVLQLFGQRSGDITRCQNCVLCDLPNDLENPALLVTGNNELYIAGGDHFGASVCSMYKWSPEDNQFEDMTIMQIARKQFCLVQLDKYIYAVGGCNMEGNLSSVARYLEDSDDWDFVCPMPVALRCFCAVPYKGKLYVFGGESEKLNKKMKMRGKRELNRNAMCYDPREDKWTVLAEMGTARALAGCAVCQNKIYVIGGFAALSESWLKDKSPENCLTSVEIYNPETNSWSLGPDLPMPLCAMGVVKYYGTIYVLGGENEDDMSMMVYYLNCDENRWEQKTEQMLSGVTETTIHSSYAVINIDMDLD